MTYSCPVFHGKLTATLPEDDVWGIPWRWYGMAQYDREFHVSETWWKGVRVVEFTLMLRAFGRHGLCTNGI